MQQSADCHHRHHLPPLPPPPDFFFQFFPNGLKVLLVGSDDVTQNCIKRQLRPPHYHLTLCHDSASAFQQLLHKDASFDLILSDVFLQDMDGYQFIKDQVNNTNIPHVAICGDETSSSIMMAFRLRVCYVLLKPVSECEIRNLWQHVFKRREQLDQLENNGYFFNGDNLNHQQNQSIRHQNNEGCSFFPAVSRDRSHKRENDNAFVANNNYEDERSRKKRRLVWSEELLQRFIDAVNRIGLENAVPTKILKLMNETRPENEPKLTRQNISSRLQKYRHQLEKEEAKRRLVMNAMLVNQMGPYDGSGESSYEKVIGYNNITGQPLTIGHQLYQYPDIGAFQPPPQNPNNNNSDQLLEPSRNIPHCTDEESLPWIVQQQMQMQMQTPQQNFTLGHQAVPLAMVPSSSLAGNGSNMMQQQQQITQNLVPGYPHAGNVNQLDHHQQQLIQNLAASVASYGTNHLQITQNLASGGGFHHLESSQNIASGTCYGDTNNMQHHQDQNLLASGSSYVNNDNINNNNEAIIRTEATPVIRDNQANEFCSNFDDQ